MQLSINLAKFTAKEAAFLNLYVETPHAHYFIVSRRARYHPQYIIYAQWVSLFGTGMEWNPELGANLTSL